MTSTALVFLGAGIGGVPRHGANLAVLRSPSAGWLAFPAGEGRPQELRFFLTTGILGGFTAVSAFSLDAVLPAQRGEVGAALGSVLGFVAISLAALVAGFALMRWLP
jgi:CrcB protein